MQIAKKYDVEAGEPAELQHLRSFENLPDDEIASLVSEQYDRTTSAVSRSVYEMVRFGAILEALDSKLTAEAAKHRNQHSGTSLKAWLIIHCPEVHYETARSYIQAARGTRKLAKIAEDVPLLPMMGMDPIPDAAQEAHREQVMKVIEQSSLRVLRSASAARLEAAGGRGAVAAPLVRRTPEENAVTVVYPPLQHYLKHRASIQSAVKFLRAEKIEEALATLAEFEQLFRDELAARREEEAARRRAR